MNASICGLQQPRYTSLFKKSPLAAAILVCCAQSVMAQGTAGESATLEEVKVTAQRRTERSLDVPIAITAIGGEQLGKGEVLQLSDIQTLTPGLRFDNTGAFAQPTIRGVGTAVVVAGGSSNVGVYSDGFYAPSPLMVDTELLNVESVQVLKGPQGTLFGRNSTGGAILVSTTDPSSEERGEVQISYGSYNTHRYALYATGGSEALAFDVAGLLRESDGYLENIISGRDDDGEYENSTVRLGMKMQPTDRLSVLLRYAYADTDDNSWLATSGYEDGGITYATAANFGGTVATRPYRVSNDFLPSFNAESSSTQLTLKADLGFADFTSYTQYFEEKATHTEDFDISSSVVQFHFIFDNSERVFSQEFLLSSSSDGPLQWTTGLFYLENESVFEGNRGAQVGNTFFLNGGSGVNTNSVAVFGDMTYALLDNLFLTVGVRYSEEEVVNAYFDVPTTPTSNTLVRTDVPDIDDEQLTPRVALRFEPNDTSSIYASYTEGYKPGILNVGGSTLVGIEVKPEEIKAYEVGYKYSAGALRFDVSTYYYDYTNLQVASYDGAMSVIRNAADSTILGVEAQARYAISESLELNVGFNYNDAEYDEFDESQIWIDMGTFFMADYVDASGNQMQHSPELTATLGLNYRTDLAGGLLEVAGNIYHTSDFYFDSSETYEQDAYQLLSLRAEWTDPSGRQTIGIYGDNLTDEEYYNQVLPQQLGVLTTWGAPRTFGVSLGVKF